VCRSHVTTAARSFVTDVTGATSFRQTTKLESAIAVMLFIAEDAMKWISVRTAVRLFATRVLR